MPTRTPTVNMDGYVALTCSRRSGLDLDPEALKGCKVSKDVWFRLHGLRQWPATKQIPCVSWLLSCSNLAQLSVCLSVCLTKCGKLATKTSCRCSFGHPCLRPVFTARVHRRLTTRLALTGQHGPSTRLLCAHQPCVGCRAMFTDRQHVVKLRQDPHWDISEYS